MHPTQMNPELKTISAMLSEIGELQNLILYYENRILHKRMAIQEIFASAELREEKPAPMVPENHTMRHMILTAVRDLVPPFNSGHIKKACLTLFPEYHHKILTNIYTTIKYLTRRGELLTVPGGFAVPTTKNTKKISTNFSSML